MSEKQPRVRQSLKVVGRAACCFRCEGGKEIASYYCVCGSFLCALYVLGHKCLVSQS
ncbi:MAG: hypothetical protein ACRECH_16235 [Nitrososphaerales archaeon]